MNKKAKIAIGICVPLVVLGGAGGAAAAIILNKHKSTVEPIVAVKKNLTVEGGVAVLEFKMAKQPTSNEVKIKLHADEAGKIKLLGNDTTPEDAVVTVRDQTFSQSVALISPLTKDESTSFSLEFDYGAESTYTITGFHVNFKFTPAPHTLTLQNNIRNGLFVQSGKTGQIVSPFTVIFDQETMSDEDYAKVTWEITNIVTEQKATEIRMVGKSLQWDGNVAEGKYKIKASYKLDSDVYSAEEQIAVNIVSPKLVGGETALQNINGASEKKWTISGADGIVIDQSKVNYDIEMINPKTKPYGLSVDSSSIIHWKGNLNTFGSYVFKLKASFNDTSTGIGYSAESNEITLTILNAKIETVAQIPFAANQSFTKTYDLKFLIGSSTEPEMGVLWENDGTLPAGWELSVDSNNQQFTIKYSATASFQDGMSIYIRATKGMYSFPINIPVGNLGEDAYTLVTPESSAFEYSLGKSATPFQVNCQGVKTDKPVTYSLLVQGGDATGLTIDKNTGYVSWTNETCGEAVGEPKDCSFKVQAEVDGFTIVSSETRTITKYPTSIVNSTSKYSYSLMQYATSGDEAYNAFQMQIGEAVSGLNNIKYSIEYDGQQTNEWLKMNPTTGLLYWENVPLLEGTLNVDVIASVMLNETDYTYQAKRTIPFTFVARPEAAIIGDNDIIRQSNYSDAVEQYEYSTFAYEFKLGGQTITEGVTWSCVADTEHGTTVIPNWLKFDTGTGVLEWDYHETPYEGAEGEYYLKITGSYEQNGEVYTADKYVCFVLISASIVHDGQALPDPWIVQQGVTWVDPGQFKISAFGTTVAPSSSGVAMGSWAEYGWYKYDGENITIDKGKVSVDSDIALGQYQFRVYLYYEGTDGYVISVRSNDYRFDVNATNKVSVTNRQTSDSWTMTSLPEEAYLNTDYIFKFKVNTQYHLDGEGTNTSITVGDQKYYYNLSQHGPQYCTDWFVQDGNNYTVTIPSNVIQTSNDHILINLVVYHD